jgi:segregation and condensation protein B
MSLKAKLEAVIYAAEEPVTLAQLAAIFAADAFEWKAEQEAASAEESAQAAETTPFLGEDFGYTEAEASAQTTPDEDQPAEEAGESPATAEAAGEAPAAPAETETEGELKRQARQRDREVRGIIKKLLDEIVASYNEDNRGVEIREIAGGYRMATKPECHDAVRLFVKSLKPALKLSLAALETLAVIAYKQPVTGPEVSEIRGVESAGVLGSLLARKLIATAGRKQVIGRPILYKTTKEFLLRFGLKDIAELPSMEEFEKMAAVELEEPGSEQESEAGAEKDQKEIGWNDELESDAESDEFGTNPPMNESEAGGTPAPDEPLPQRERQTEEDGSPEGESVPTPASAERQDAQPVEAPAAMAAANQPASDDPAAAPAPAAYQEPAPEPVPPKDSNPAIDAE